MSTMESGLQALDYEAIAMPLSPTTDDQGPRTWALKQKKAASLTASQDLFLDLRPSSSSLYLLPTSILIPFFKVELLRLPVTAVLLWALTNTFLFCTAKGCIVHGREVSCTFQWQLLCSLMVLTQSCTNYSPQTKSSPLSILIKFYWNIQVFSLATCVLSVAELNSCPRELRPCVSETQNIYFMALYRESLLTLFVNYYKALFFFHSLIYSSANAHKLRVFETPSSSLP